MNTASLVSIAILCGCVEAAAQQAHVNLDWNPHKNIQNLTPYGANVISPEVRDDRTVTFRLKAPDARTVALTGGPMLLAIGKGNAPIPFEKGADGVWTLTVGPLKPNMYIYRLLVDGVAVVDPEQHADRVFRPARLQHRRRARRRTRLTTTRSASRTAASLVTSITRTC